MSSLDFLDTVLSETLTEEEYLQERKARSESSDPLYNRELEVVLK